MIIVGYGGGTDSTAMLVGLWQRRIPVDLILFSAVKRGLTEADPTTTDWEGSKPRINNGQIPSPCQRCFCETA